MDASVALLIVRLIISAIILFLLGMLFYPALRRGCGAKERKALLRGAALALCRGGLFYIVFLILGGTLSVVFLSAGTGIVQSQRLPLWPLNLCCTVLLPLSFHSIHRAAELYDKESQRAYPFGSEREYSFGKGAKILLNTEPLRRKLLGSLAASLTLLLILPYNLGYTSVVGSFNFNRALTYDEASLICLSLTAPIIILLIFIAKASAHKWWNICRSTECERILNPNNHNVRLFLEILKIAAIYGITYPLLPGSIMMVVTTALVIGLFTLWIWLAIFGSAIALIIFRLYRAYRRRSKYIKKLTRVAIEQGYTVTVRHGARLGLFLPHRRADLTLSRGNVTYDCKLIGTTKRSRPMYISPKGFYAEKRTISILRMSLFHIMTETTYEFEGENKLLVFCPMPKKLYLNYGRTDTVPDDGDGGSVPTLETMKAIAMSEGAKTRGRSIHGPGYISDVDRGIIRPFETGERLGEYKLFSANDMLSAVRNKYIDR